MQSITAIQIRMKRYKKLLQKEGYWNVMVMALVEELEWVLEGDD